MKIAQKIVSLKDGRSAILKSASPDDADLVLQHLKISHKESYRNLNQSSEYWNAVSVEEERKFLTDLETGKNKFMIMAWVDEKIVGGLGLFSQTAEFTKHNATLGMSIQNAYCNSGLGTHLMNTALENAKQIGLRRIDLTVRTYNTAGIALYEKVGFQRTGLLKEMALIDGQYVDEYSYQILLKD